MTMFFCVVERTMWYWFNQCSQKASADHSRHRGWLLLIEICSYSVASIASCRKFCSKLLQWMLCFVAMGSLSVVLLESHPTFRFVPNDNKWTLIVGLLADRPEKCLELRNFSDVVIRRCHKLHPSLSKSLTDHQTWTKSTIRPRVLDLWTTLQVSRSLGPPSMTMECCRIRCIHRLFWTILSSSVYHVIKTLWDGLIVLGFRK